MISISVRHIFKLKEMPNIMEPSEIVTVDCYQCQLIRLSQVLERKRLYAAKGHFAFSTKDTLMSLGWNILQHQAHSSDICSLDYHLLRSMQHALSDVQFQSVDEI